MFTKVSEPLVLVIGSFPTVSLHRFDLEKWARPLRALHVYRAGFGQDRQLLWDAVSKFNLEKWAQPLGD